MSLCVGLPVMKRRDEREAVAIGRRILGPVGDLVSERLDWGNAGGVHVVHVRRRVTDEEHGLLPAWFLACPAIHQAGTNPLTL